MDVKHGLTRRRIAVHHHPVTVIRKSFIVGKTGHRQKHLADNFLVAINKVVDGRDMPLRN